MALDSHSQSDEENSSQTGDSWFSEKGLYSDIVISTRVDLHRNLANYPFPSKMSNDEARSIYYLVFDAFNHTSIADSCRAILTSNLDSNGKRILQEREVLEKDFENPSSGLVLRNDGKVSCMINGEDHLKLSAFKSGYAPLDVLKEVSDLDIELQKSLQFAAGAEFGYLTSNLLDAGSGMKYSFVLHLPGLALMEKISLLSAREKQKGFNFYERYGTSGMDFLSSQKFSSSSLGCFYVLGNINCFTGSEADQEKALEDEIQYIMEIEKEARSQAFEKKPSIVKNYVLRAISLARASLFVTLREGLDMAGSIMTGLDSLFIGNVSRQNLNSLLYRMQDGHLNFVAESGNFPFDEDIAESEKMKRERLRALIIQETLENVRILNKGKS